MEDANARRELRWLERPSAELVRLAWPIAVSTLSYSAMTLVDTAFVAGLGSAALAGVGLGGVAAFTLLCFAIGVLRGVKILVSQAVGAGRGERARDYLAAGLAMAVALGAAVAVLGQLVAPLLGAVAASAEAAGHAGAYLSVRTLGAPLLLAYVALRETRYGQGDARTPMVAAVAGNALNIALDYALIYGAGLGVAGAAWASVCASAVELGIMVGFHRRLLTGVRGGEEIARCAAAVWRVGLPSGVQFLLEVGSFALLTAILASISELDLAAHQIVLHLQHVSFLPAYAVAEAGSVMAGQAVGARRDELVLGVARRALVVAATYTALCTLAFAIGATWLGRAFTDDPVLAAKTSTLVYIALLFMVADGAYVVARNILRGTGDVRYAAVVGIACSWVLTPPVAWLLGAELGLGAAGGWIGLSAEIILGALLLWQRLLGGGWHPAAARTRAEVVH